LQLPVLEAAHALIGHSERTTLTSGTKLDHYEIISLLAVGGMGQVYLAEDTTLKRRVALKLLPLELTRDEHALHRFGREALAASALNHPNIVTIHECGQADGLRFIVSEFVEGSTLREKLANGRLELNTILDIAIQIASALDAAHCAGIIHRDIKPENLMVRRDGLVKVLDFGIAKLSRPRGLDLPTDGARISVTKPAMLIGTAAYMSPEQATGKELDARTDLFSFGVVLHEITTGVSPFSADTTGAILERILTHPPAAVTQLNPEAPKELEEVINKALEKDRNLRYQHASEMRSDLQRLKQDTNSNKLLAVNKSELRASKARVWIAIAAAVLVAAVLWAVLAPRHPLKLTDKDTLVLADFTNRTSDPVFDGTLRQGLAVQLEQSPFLSLVSQQRIRRTLQMMVQSPDVQLTPEVANEVCQRVGGTAVLEGAISQIGTRYLLTLKAVSCSSGESLASAEAQSSDENHVFDALDRATAEIRTTLGESFNSVHKFNTPLEEATTPSLEALQAFTAASKNQTEKSDDAAAVPLFQQAIRIDSNFAMAYAWLAVCYSNLGEHSLAAVNSRTAFELRERVSEREKLLIESVYHNFVTGDLSKAKSVNELLAQLYPRDPVARGNLGDIFSHLGSFDDAMRAFRESLRLEPDSALAYGNLVDSYLALNHLKEARAKIEEAYAKGLDSSFLRFNVYKLHFLENADAGMAHQIAAQPLEVEHALLEFEARTAAYFGGIRRSREFSRWAVTSAEQGEEREVASAYEAEAALRESLFGNGGEARERAKAALGRLKGRDVEYLAGLALATAGDAMNAQAQVDDLETRFREDTLVRFVYLPTIRAQLALNARNPATAIQVLQTAAPYEKADMHTVYMRGQAYLASHSGGEAALEFQKILDHRGLIVNLPIGPLAHLGLARAYALQRDIPKARAAYQDFLSVWKDADPDIPIVKQAKAEYARLQ
jgi:serine/threonine protein kinase/Flp pilus assembly protein TadD